MGAALVPYPLAVTPHQHAAAHHSPPCPVTSKDPDVNPSPNPGAMSSLRILVADDHPMWRAAVERDLVAAGHQVVATASDGPEAIRRALATRPDLLLLDLQMPGASGDEVTAAVTAAVEGAHVLILSASAEETHVLAAVKAGAVGYLLKSASADELLSAVEAAGRGEAVFTASLAGLVLGEYRTATTSTDAHPRHPQLTERETEVLRMVAKGMSYRQIAERLFLSHRTVQNHVQNTLRKLQMHNRVELTRYALENGLDS